MKSLIVKFISVYILFLSCNISNQLPSMIIRQNYFDSNHFSLDRIDTNKVNRLLYSNLFIKIRFDNETKCLLMKMYSDGYVWEEYGLYDYKTEEFYYTSIKNDRPYKFKQVNTKTSQEMYTRMKKFIKNPELLSSFTFDSASRHLYDGVNVEASLISSSNKNEVIVKSFHW